MQITRETVQLNTPFIFKTDRCSCGKHPLGHDYFEIELPLKLETELPKKYKWQPDAHKRIVDPLIKELRVIWVKDESKMKPKEAKANLDRIHKISEQLLELGVDITPCKFELEVSYEVAADDMTHCRISYSEFLGKDKFIGILFQSNLNTVETLNLIYDTVSKGLDVDSLNWKIEEGDDNLENEHEENENHMALN